MIGAVDHVGEGGAGACPPQLCTTAGGKPLHHQSKAAGGKPLHHQSKAAGGKPLHHHHRGFTLLEVAIVLLLVALIVAMAVPAFGALTGAQLKEEAGRMTGLIRDTYARTALIGKSTRIVLDMEENAWWVEESPTVARLHRVKLEADRDGKVALDPKDERIEDIEEDTEDEEELAKLELLAPPAFQRIEGEDGKPHKLPSGVQIRSVWAEHLDDRVSGGQVALYFYPGGFTEEAHVTLADGDEEDARILTLVVSSLTGEVDVVEEIPRVPDLEDDDE